MRSSRSSVVIGIIVSVFLSPFVGGGVAGYLHGSGSKRGAKIGGIVGVTVGSMVSAVLLLYTYYGVYRPVSALPAGSALPDATRLIGPYLVATTLCFISSVGLAIIGGAIGSSIAGQDPPQSGECSSTS